MICDQFWLRDINHDTVSNCSKIVSCWLGLVFNVVDQSFKKRYAYKAYKAGKLYLDLRRKEKNMKKYQSTVADYPEE